MQQWRMITGVSDTPGAEGYPVYGVAATLPDGSVWSWADVDPDPAVVQILCHRLQWAQPAPCHFRDIVLDFIDEMAAKV